MQLQYANDSTDLLERPFAGSLTHDYTTPSDRKHLRPQTSSLIDVDAIYPVNTTLLLWSNCTRLHDTAHGTRVGARKRYFFAFATQELDDNTLLKTQSTHNLEWVFEVIHSSDPDGAKYVAPTIDGINSLISERNFELIDRVFSIVPPATASRHVLLALLRSTAPVRSKLNEWKKYTLLVRESFENRGLDAARLLKGLLD